LTPWRHATPGSVFTCRRHEASRLGGATPPHQDREGTADEIKSDLAGVKAKLTALTAELHGEFQAQTDAVKSAIAKLQTAVSDMTAHVSASAASGVATALAGVASATRSLLAALAPQCGAASTLR